MSQKSRRKVAELRRRIFFFGDQHKIGEKDASIGMMTFFLEITLKPDKNDEKIFGIFTLSLERSHYFRHFRRRSKLRGNTAAGSCFSFGRDASVDIIIF